MSYTILSLVLCLSTTVSSSVRGTRTYREQGGPNHKIVNEIYWRSWVHNIFEFSPADSAFLYYVAEQHPHKGGTAVYDARVMLGLDFFDYDDGDEQKSASYYEDEISNADEQGEIKFILYPNPASSLINYQTILLDNESASLILYDVLGRPIFNKNLGKDNKDGIIDINEFDPGLYTYEVIINYEIKISGTFIIN